MKPRRGGRVIQPAAAMHALRGAREPKSPNGAHHMKTLYWITLILLVVGGLNWLLVGLFDFDLVASIFGDMSALSRLVYVVVGLSAITVLALSARLVRTHP